MRSHLELGVCSAHQGFYDYHVWQMFGCVVRLLSGWNDRRAVSIWFEACPVGSVCRSAAQGGCRIDRLAWDWRCTSQYKCDWIWDCMGAIPSGRCGNREVVRPWVTVAILRVVIRSGTVDAGVSTVRGRTSARRRVWTRESMLQLLLLLLLFLLLVLDLLLSVLTSLSSWVIWASAPRRVGHLDNQLRTKQGAASTTLTTVAAEEMKQACQSKLSEQ